MKPDAKTLIVTYKKALQNKPMLDGLLAKTAQQTGARPISNLKNPTTTVSKTIEKNQEDPKRKYGLDDVNDVARGRLVYGSVDALSKGIQSFKQNIKGTPAKVAKEEDFFKHPENGYQGYHIDLAFPNGQHSEVQFHTLQSFASALATHQAHEQYGDTMPKDVKKKDEAQAQAIQSLPNDKAAQIAKAVEAQNALPQAAAQIDAVRTAAGSSKPLITPQVMAAAKQIQQQKGHYASV